MAVSRTGNRPIRPEEIEWYSIIESSLELDSQVDDFSHRQFRSWLAFFIKLGDVTRQDPVSMVPVFLIEVNHSHRMIDLCAGPGSKTSQLAKAMLFDPAKSEL